MSRPTRTSADIVTAASEPCHHRREPFGPCPICLEDEIGRETGGINDWYDHGMDELRGQHAAELADRDDTQMAIENERDAAIDAARALVKAVRRISGQVNNSNKEYIEQQLDAAADKADTAT